MVASFGPRTYLVGCVLSGLLAKRESNTHTEIESILTQAIVLADVVMEKMQWPTLGTQDSEDLVHGANRVENKR